MLVQERELGHRVRLRLRQRNMRRYPPDHIRHIQTLGSFLHLTDWPDRRVSIELAIERYANH